MGKNYSQLKYASRVRIEVLLKEGKTQSYIASKIGVSQSTLSREISRGTEGKELYLADRAHKRAVTNAFNQRRRAPLKDYETWDFVTDRLRKKMQPEAICGRLRIERGKSLTVQAVYSWLHRLPQSQKASLTKHLPYFNRKRRKKYRISGGYLSPETSMRIENRPKHAEKRAEIGHWETDNIGGKKGDKTTVTVTIERKSRFVVAGKLNNLKAETKTIHMKKRLRKYEVKSMTADNGKENAGYAELEETLATKYYFCDPYSSWQKGSVENAIGWLRREIPKGKSLDEVSHQKLAWAVKRYNNTPKKCLDWLTPKEVFVDNLKPQDFMHFEL